jgi:hypothetical protein
LISGLADYRKLDAYRPVVSGCLEGFGYLDGCGQAGVTFRLLSGFLAVAPGNAVKSARMVWMDRESPSLGFPYCSVFIVFVVFS